MHLQLLFHALFGVKTLSGTLLGPAFNESGHGARHDKAARLGAGRNYVPTVHVRDLARVVRREGPAGRRLVGCVW